MSKCNLKLGKYIYSSQWICGLNNNNNKKHGIFKKNQAAEIVDGNGLFFLIIMPTSICTVRSAKMKNAPTEFNVVLELAAIIHWICYI